MFFNRLLLCAAFAVVFAIAVAQGPDDAQAPDGAAPGGRRSNVVKHVHHLPGMTVTRKHKLPRTEKFSSHRVEGMSNGGDQGPTDPNGGDNGGENGMNNNGLGGFEPYDPNLGPVVVDASGNVVDGNGGFNGRGKGRGRVDNGQGQNSFQQQAYQSYLKPYNANGPRGLYADESLSSDSLQGIYRLFYDLIINFHNAEQSLEKGVRDKESDGIAAMIKDIIGSQGLLGKILGMAGGGGGGLG